MSGTIVLKLESIGDDCRSRLRAYRKGQCQMGTKDLLRCIGLERRGPWVAEIVAGENGMRQRVFVKGMKSYRDANGIGSRGVHFYYHLEPGRVYEVQAPRTWNKVDRYFCRHAGDKLIKITEAELLQCLR